ncbi:hypothetical protein JDS92_30375, partial [Bacillus cereus group sp. N12]|nr:hypothetical protein [Bacillus cereus group sp. N12]
PKGIFVQLEKCFRLNIVDLVSPIWLVLSFLLIVIGEVCLSPSGLSITTKLAPAAFSAQTISLWFLSTASAQAINAQVVKLYD